MDAASVFVPGWLPAPLVEFEKWLLPAAFKPFARLEVRGGEHLPAGGFVASTNHISYFDAPLIFCLLRGRPVTAFAADTYRPKFFFRVFVQQIDTIWVHRGAIGPSTLKHALQALRAGRVIGVAPEGTRSHTAQLLPGKPGAVSLAAAAGRPIVPIAITGTEQLAAAIKSFRWLAGRRVTVTVTFGEPLTIPPLGRGERAEKLDELTTELMCRLAALLPPAYRGVYADHPQVRADS